MRYRNLSGVVILGSMVACSETGSNAPGGSSLGGNLGTSVSAAGSAVPTENRASGGRTASSTVTSGGALGSGGSSTVTTVAATSGGQVATSVQTSGGTSTSSHTSNGGQPTRGGAAAAGSPSVAGKGGAVASAGGARGVGGAAAGAASGGKTSAGGGTANGGKSSASAGAAGGGIGPQAGAAGACAPTVSVANRALASKALDELFVQKDVKAIDRYWSDPYYQHNPSAKSGVSTFRSLMGSFVTGASFSYQRLLTLAECDLAVVLGRYSQTGVIFDMFRIQNDKIMEHWDSDTNQASNTEGLDPLDETGPSAANKQLYLDFATAVLVGGDTARINEYLSPSYSEHFPTAAAGSDGLRTYLASEGITYTKVHHVIADGNYVFSLSEGKRNGTAYGFYDLFRLDSGRIVEHWGSRRSVPASTASGLPIF